jgi:hypothetical protein
MSIDVERLDAADADDWNRFVERSPQGTPFHRYETLAVCADHSGSDLHTLVGYKGQEPVGIFPGFGLTTAGLGTLFSPPPDLLVPYLGPALLNYGKLSTRKAERRHQQFVDGCLDLLADEVGYRYGHLRTTTRYDDLRPLQWGGFEVSPAYTYVVDIDRSEDDLLASFSSDARKNVRNTDPASFEITEGDADDVRRIVGMVADRYAEQEETYDLTPEFAVDLYEALPEGSLRPVVCHADDAFVGGILAVEGSETIYRWQGAADFDCDLPVNDLLDWHLMTEGRERGVTAYDLIGANTQRLNKYKAKWSPDLAAYHVAEFGHPVVRAAAHLYKQYG